MARKLGLRLAFVAATVLAGCQSPDSSRLAGNNNYSKSPAVARQGAPAPTSFPQYGPTNKSGFSSANVAPPPPNTSAFGNSPALPTGPNVPPIGSQTNNPPQGPQGQGTSTTNNRSNVTITQPVSPVQAPAAPAEFQQIAPPPPLPALPQQLP